MSESNFMTLSTQFNFLQESDKSCRIISGGTKEGVSPVIPFNKLKTVRFLILPLILIASLVWLDAPQASKGFETGLFNVERVMEHIRILSSAEYSGRMTGTPGNDQAVAYIRRHLESVGIKPVPNKGYDQKFETLVPRYGTQAVFQYQKTAGETTSFKQYSDYRMVSSGMGGSIDFTGELLFADLYLYDLPPEVLKDRVIIMESAALSEETLQYALKNGAKGIFSYIYNYGTDTGTLVKIKSTSVLGKKGPVLGVGMISQAMYNSLKLEAEAHPLDVGVPQRTGMVIGIVPNVRIRQDIRFDTVEAANIIGMIPGTKTDEFLLIGAHMDHVGAGAGEDYFPGALDNASGTAMILEIARLCAQQDLRPDKTILLAAWNSEESGLAGSAYYAAHPMVPLAETEVINLDMVGGQGVPKILVGPGNTESQVLGSRIMQIGEDLSLDLKREPMDGSDHMSFARTGNRAVMIHQGDLFLHQQGDTISNIDSENLNRIGLLMGNILKRDAYGESKPDYFTGLEKTAISLFLSLALFAYGVEIWHLNFPEHKIGRVSSESLYFSTSYQLGSKLLQVAIPASILILLVTIAQLPRDLNLIAVNGHWDTNFSGYLTLKKTVFYLRSLLQNGFGDTLGGASVAGIIRSAFLNSFMLLGVSVALSLPIGVLKGLFDAYSSRRDSELRSFSSVVLLSVPDVLWIFMASSAMILVGGSPMFAAFLPVSFLRGWLLPLVTLSIMPSIYISRIAFVGFRHELNKPYISALKAKGASKRRIFFSHLLRPVFERSFGAMRGLIAVLISNLIVIEYLFDYKGLANYILQADKSQDKLTFVSLILSMTVLYVLMIVSCMMLQHTTETHKGGGNR